MTKEKEHIVNCMKHGVDYSIVIDKLLDIIGDDKFKEEVTELLKLHAPEDEISNIQNKILRLIMNVEGLDSKCIDSRYKNFLMDCHFKTHKKLEKAIFSI